MKSKKLVFMFVLLASMLLLASCRKPDVDEDPVYTIALNETSKTLKVGETLTLTATVKKDDEIVDEAVVWESNNNEVATVDDGLVTAIAEGETSITATAKDKTATFTLTVEEDEVIVETFLIISSASQTLFVGEEFTLTAEMTDGTTPTLSWESSDEDIVTVNNGVVKAHKSGSATITVSFGELSDQAVITVKDKTELIFPVLPEKVLINDLLNLNVVTRKNNVVVDEDIVITGEGFVIENDEVKIVEDGKITITVTYDTHTITRTTTAYIPIETLSDLNEVRNNLNGFYQLQNDINIDGEFITLAHYNDGHSGSTSGFQGEFDGNNYTISNYFTRFYNQNNAPVVANNSMFGTIGANGKIKNLNLVNVTIDQRISGALGTINYGTIENVFVDGLVLFDTIAEANNPNGIVVSKNMGTIRNTIAIANFGPNVVNTINVGGIAGRTYNASLIENSFTIGRVGLVEEATPNFDGNQPDLGTFTNTQAFKTVNEFYNNANIDSFNDNWIFKTGLYPHLKGIETTVELISPTDVIYTNTQVQLDINSEYSYNLSIKDNINGVNITKEGLLSITNEVDVDNFTVVLRSLYDEEAIFELDFNVLRNTFEATANETNYEITTYEETSNPEDYIIVHGINVTFENEVYEGEVFITSTNEDVLTVDETNFTLHGDGTARIIVSVKDEDDNLIELLRIDVIHNHYLKVSTKEDFLTIGNNSETMSAKYYLANDIDFGGDTIYAFSSYQTRATKTFKGIFDGMNHTISNFSLDYTLERPTDNDISIFGFVSPTGIIRNTNFVGVKSKDRTGVVSSWNEGLIENIYLEIEFEFLGGDKINTNNPAGLIVSKNRAGANINNVVVVAKFNDTHDLSLVGGVVGINDGEVTNAHLITSSNVDVLLRPKAPVNSGKYDSLNDFYLAEVTLNDNWTLNEGYLPHLGTMDEVLVLNESLEGYFDTVYIIQINLSFGYKIELVEPIDGVLISENRVSIPSVVPNNLVSVVIRSLYNESEVTIDINVVESTIEVESFKENYSFDKLILNDSNEELFAQDLEISLIKNGEPYNANIVGNSLNSNVAVIENNQVVVKGYGSTEIELLVDGALVETITVDAKVYDKGIYTKKDFEDIRITPESILKKYILMNDIDAEGTIESIGHYASGRQFEGIFEGNGFTIKNFAATYNGNLTQGNSSLFGQIGTNGIVRNLNLVNVRVVNRISGGLVTINRGLIENVYVEVNFEWDTNTDFNNPMGGVAAKNYGQIKNSIAVVSTKQGLKTDNIGAIAGRTYPNSLIENTYAISSLDIVEAATPTNDGANQALGEHINALSFDNLEDFYNNANLEVFNDKWVFSEGFYPYYDQLDINYNISNLYEVIYIGTSWTILIEGDLKHHFVLESTIDGVTLENNVLTVSSTVELGEIIVIRLIGLYPSEDMVIEVEVLDTTLELIEGQTEYNFTYIKDHSTVEEKMFDINIVIHEHNVLWEGVLNGVSLDSSIAVIEDGKIKVISEGTTSIELFVGDIPIHTITVKVQEYLPILNISDFNAIGTNNETLAKRYILLADLDFENEVFNAFTSWATNNASARSFKGIFDGNGYTISNLKPAVSSGADKSIFGHLSAGAIVRNLNLRGIVLTNRVGVISSFNLGLIENITIEALVESGTTFGDTAANPAGVVASKNQAGATVRNVLVVLAYEADVEIKVAGGIVGRQGGTLDNIHLITTETIDLAIENLSTITNGHKYASIEEFYLTHDESLFDNNWLLDGTSIPKIK